MNAADTPPPVAEIVVSHEDGSRLVATRDTPLTLAKGARREEAVLRQAVFMTASLAVVKPTPEATPSYRWSYKGFLQRQLCVTSVSGLFACSTAEIEPLPDVETGQAAMSAGDHPLADAASQALEAALRARADTLFAADRAAKLDPLLKAAGVRVAPPPAAGRRAGGGRGAEAGSAG